MKNTIKLLSVALLVTNVTQVFAAAADDVKPRKRVPFNAAAFLAPAPAPAPAPVNPLDQQPIGQVQVVPPVPVNAGIASRKRVPFNAAEFLALGQVPGGQLIEKVVREGSSWSKEHSHQISDFKNKRLSLPVNGDPMFAAMAKRYLLEDLAALDKLVDLYDQEKLAAQPDIKEAQLALLRNFGEYLDRNGRVSTTKPN